MKKFSSLLKPALTAILATAGIAAFAQVRPTSVTPAAGFVNGEIHTVVLDFSIEYNEVKFSDRALNYYDPAETVDKEGVIYFGGLEIEQSRDMYSASIDGTTITFTTKTPWTKEGQYSLMIPAGALIFTTESGATVQNSLINIIWKLGDFANPVVTPEAGVITSMATISYELPEGYSISSGYPAMFGPKIYEADANGIITNTTPVAQYKTLDNNSSWKGGRVLTYSNPKTTTYPSTEFTPEHNQYYVVTLSNSCYKVMNDAKGTETGSLEVSTLYHFMDNAGNADVAYTLDPADGATVNAAEFSQIVISVPVEKYEGLTANMYLVEEEHYVARLVNGDKTIELLPKEYPNNYHAAILELADPITEGTWTLEIPKDYFFVDVIENDAYKRLNLNEITATYTVINDIGAGVADIAEETELNVYSVDGLKHNVESLSALPKGLWIVNGKKVVVK